MLAIKYNCPVCDSVETVKIDNRLAREEYDAEPEFPVIVVNKVDQSVFIVETARRCSSCNHTFKVSANIELT